MAYKTPKVYTMFFQPASTNPLDSTTYYIGGSSLAWSTSVVRNYIPKQGRITGISIYLNIGVNATAENTEFYIRLNNTTDYTITTTATLNASAVFISKFDLNIPVINTDYISLKIVTPAWVTNPTTVYLNAHVLVEFD